MKKVPTTTIVRPGLEKSQAACRIEIEAPIVLAFCFWETNQQRKHRELWLKTSVRNPAHGAIEPPISPMNRRLYSSPAIAAFRQEPFVSSSFGCDISAPAARQHSAPASSAKPSREPVLNLLPHENDIKICLRPFWRRLRKAAGKMPAAFVAFTPGKQMSQNKSRSCEQEHAISEHPINVDI